MNRTAVILNEVTENYFLNLFFTAIQANHIILAKHSYSTTKTEMVYNLSDIN